MARRDDDEFVAFAGARQAQLRRTAYLICGDWHQASDIVQEALIRVYVAWPRLVRRDALGAYARRAVVNVAIDMSRKRSSTEIPTVADEERPHDTDVAGSVTRQQTLLAALARLPERQRACVVLRYFEDLPVSEVAEVLGCTQGTVKSQTSRAISTLQSILSAQGQGELVVTGEGEQPW
jgi:RNA polymerase sigma-70 factor (sigma-E family)